ncbi:sunset domain-containing protein [Saccharopolyspora sp. NPDC002578]
MVWLFTQVWLWSVAAFLLGSVITWLLFVVPLRRKLRKVRSDYAENVAQQGARHDRQVRRPHDPAPPRKVERTTVQPRWEQEPDEDPLPEPPEPAPQPPAHTARLPHPGAEQPAGADARAEVSVRGGSQVADLVVDDDAPRPAEQRPTAQRPQQQAAPAARPTGAWQEDESAYAGRSSGGWWPSRGRDDETPAPANRSAPWTIPADHEPEDDAPRPSSADIGQALGRGESTSVDPVADRPAESASTWFQKDDAPESAEPTRPAESTGGGTEIFARPDVGSEAPARSGPPGLSGAAELSAALGLSDLSSSPRPAAEPARDTAEPVRETAEPVRDVAEPVRETAEPAPEPEPEPEPEQPAEPAASDRAEEREDDHGFAGNLRALVESRGSEFADSAGTPSHSPDVPVIAESEQTPLPRRTPGAGPRPGMPQPPRSQGAAWHADPQAQANRRRESLAAPQEPSQQDGHMIKGDFGSRRYHAPDSPHYDRIVAEVWFRSEVDAEEAGFVAWND